MQNGKLSFNMPDISKLLALHKSKKTIASITLKKPVITNPSYNDDHAKSLPAVLVVRKRSVASKTFDEARKKSKNSIRDMLLSKPVNAELPNIPRRPEPKSMNKVVPVDANKHVRLYDSTHMLPHKLSNFHNNSITVETTYVRQESPKDDFERFKPADPNYKPISYAAFNRIASEKNVGRNGLDSSIGEKADIGKAMTDAKLKVNKKKKDAPSVDLSISDDCVDVSKSIKIDARPALEAMRKTGENNKKARSVSKNVKFSETNQVIYYKQDSIIDKKYKKSWGASLFFCMRDS